MNRKSEFPKENRRQDMDWDNLPIILIVIAAILICTLAWNLGQLKADKMEELPSLTAEPIAIEEPAEEEELIEEKVEIEEKAEPKLTDRDMIAMIVMGESRGEKFIGKVAVAAVVINRSRERGMTIEEVCTEEDQFVYPYYGTVSLSCYEAVDYAMEHMSLFPKNMLYFRNTMYHEKLGIPYTQIGGHYFSTEGEPEWEIETLGEKD